VRDNAQLPPLFEPETTLTLLARARAGDLEALDALAARFLPRMRRWATGRLPGWARDLSNTDDIVQEALLATLKSLDGFEPRHDASFAVYLRQALTSRVLNEIRRVRRRPMVTALEEGVPPTVVPSAEQVPEWERRETYERALSRLSSEEREAIVGRLELGYSYRELAKAWEKPSADAARKTVERAALRMAAMLRRD
jgi:RNA polymerase sigma-70 factor (ECF subfamily)